MINRIIITLSVLALFSCSGNQEKKAVNDNGIKKADQFLLSYNKQYQQLLRIASEAEWVLNTRIVEGDTIAASAASAANEQFAAFTGSEENIKTATELLEQRINWIDYKCYNLKKFYSRQDPIHKL